ncbi:DEAD-box ATP-dependent RNA helicase 58, chloroplastic isoform X2 [Eutrema salsugineum]|uniref:DEAD-box ATP-dependent RNA helicase 58, chloroplastic isoform X2 n=1 Tax=Eutrema salsugineum TaxID=72664 RepID=UPI000CED6663|nr:DEAD-box ATP-dependent RNA helicase 58, chloroplastic isoform X2 [Eutrema salsugineum]
MASQLLFLPHVALLPKFSPFYPSLFARQKLTLFHSTTRAIKSSSNSRITINLQAVADACSEIESNGVTETTDLTLRNICEGFVPEHIIHRMEEIGFVFPTNIQREALPTLFTGRDCILHAQTGSGKTLTYLLLIFSLINPQRSSVQAVIVVPTRELGMQVTKVARMLAAKSTDIEVKGCTVMALLDGGMLRRHKSWLKAEPPAIVVATVASLCHMLEKHILRLDSVRVLVVDETVFASASIPQHKHFVHDCIQQKWTKRDVVHIHVSAIMPMPLCLLHRFVVCGKKNKHQILLALLKSDAPESAIIFAGEQSEKSKKAGNDPSTTLLIEFLKASYDGLLEILLLEEDMNFNSRAASLTEIRQGGGFLLVSTDIAARGIDLPETTHIFNFDLPQTATDYLHRAGRAGRKPFSDRKCIVTNLITSEERFVLQKFENELMFSCEELIL